MKKILNKYTTTLHDLDLWTIFRFTEEHFDMNFYGVIERYEYFKILKISIPVYVNKDLALEINNTFKFLIAFEESKC